MIESPFSLDYHEKEESIHLVGILLKYLRYWPWFLMAALLGIGMAYGYMRYAPITYTSVAKIKLIDESKDTNIASDPISVLNGGPKINLDNEIEILKSYRILKQVVEALNLDISYYEKGKIKTTEIWNPPFAITKLKEEDSLNRTSYFEIVLNSTAAQITDEQGKTSVLNYSRPVSTARLPFDLNIREGAKPKDYEGKKFIVALKPLKPTVLTLANNMGIQPTNKKSDILSLWLIGESVERSETILNELINKFNQDGILDRQMVSKRTLDFIDERFAYLSGELDSIELGKENFKRSNSLSYIESDAGISLQRKMVTEDEAANLETQVSLSDLLKSAVMGQEDYSLLPVNIGLENNGLNSLVSEYNKMAIEREKLMTTVGESHPALIALSDQLERSKLNILRTINVNQTQLKMSLRQLNREKSQAGLSFSRLPEKEKMLRSIERQQSIKENLFLLLLQKREEAALNYAVTAPSIKVVDYALTSNQPLSPQKKIVYPVALLLCMLVPFLVLFIRFSLDSKIHSKADIEKIHPEVPLLAEIPFIKGHKSIKLKDDRSVLAESFRMMSTNLGYMLPINNLNLGKVVYVTSSIDGEGKSMLAHNLSLSFASLHKKVLLLEADLRKPQLNTYYNVGNNIKGLSDYLFDPEMNWQECLYKGDDDSKFHKVCFSGTIPINAPQLLAGEGFERFLNLAKEAFDYIIVDTAPTMLVADTLLISKYADVTVYVTRAGYSDKKLLAFSKSLSETKKLKNMAYVINDVAPSKNKQYTYGYD